MILPTCEGQEVSSRTEAMPWMGLITMVSAIMMEVGYISLTKYPYRIAELSVLCNSFPERVPDSAEVNRLNFQV